METGKTEWVALEKPLPCRTTRRRILLTDEFLRFTAETFSGLLGYPIMLDDAREIAENVLRYVECLVDGENEPPINAE